MRFGSPGSWAYWQSTAGDFPARTWKGEDRGRWKNPGQQLPGGRPRPRGPQARLCGLENRVGTARCSGVRCAPRRPQPPAPLRRTPGVTLPLPGSPRASLLGDAKSQIPAESLCPFPHSFGPGAHGGPLERGEAGLGQRADPSGRAGSWTADLPPAAAPRSQAILL